MTQPRSFTSLHRAVRSARPKLRSLKRNKKDVAPRTRRHVRAVRHDFGFDSRDVREKTRKFGRCVASSATATTDFLAPDIFNRCGRAFPAGTHALRRTRAPIAEGRHRSMVPASRRASPRPRRDRVRRHHDSTGPWRCPFPGEDRKSWTVGQTDAIDPGCVKTRCLRLGGTAR
jgi:hypothetical protein